MQKFSNTIRTCLVYVAVVMLAGGYPMAAMAEAVDSVPPATSTDSAATPAPAPELEKERYNFNPDTGHWDSNRWAFNPTTNRYEPVVTPLVTEEQAAPAVTDTTPVTSNSDTTNGGAGSSVNVDTNATIDNTLNSDAVTGNAGVKNNTTGGNAATGDASAIATLFNTINSSVNSDGAEFATFVTDVVGDVHGDIMLYPMLIAAMLQAADNPSESTVAVNNDATINNNLNLNATSGNANVTGNTTAGNATTGTANTVANVMNIINSIIAANQSFVGTVNIYGNLDGDILVAPDFLPQLLAGNGANSSTSGNSLAVSSQDTQSIINNIDLNAASGNARVANNTTAGSAATGDAKTNLVLLNLSGHQIVAKDSLLVFVNVLGQWVGLIVDAPAGTSAAALGTGVVSNNNTPDLTIGVDNNSRIVNNIALNSQSGDATVANNTTAGNATTGDATASANVANISGSQLGLTGWFGVLFINVFGSWLGSFGVDTAAGNPVTSGLGGVETPRSEAAPVQPFQFIPKSESIRRAVAPVFNGLTGGQPTTPAETNTDETNQPSLTAYVPSANTPSAATAPAQQDQIDLLPFIGSAFILGLGVIATRTIIAVVRDRGALA